MLLDCAHRLGRDKIILDTCQAFYDRGIRDWEFHEFESQYLTDYDHQKAISRLRDFTAASPSHRVAKLRLASVAMRYGQNDLAPLSEATLPSPNELPMRYAVAAVRVLQWQGQSTGRRLRLPRASRTHFECHPVSINGATDQVSRRRRSKAVVCPCDNPRSLRQAARPESAGLHIARLYF